MNGSADRWGREHASVLASSMNRWLHDTWFRVEWEGLEHIPRDGGALLVSNHAGMMPVDGLLLQYGIERESGRPVYALAHDGFWRWPFIGDFLSRSGGVVAHPENAQRLLRTEQQLLAVLPEGAKGPVKPPSERYKLQRFGRGGFVETAMRAGVPIVPIVLMGTEDATPTAGTLRMFGQQAPITWNALVLGPILGAFVQLPVKIRARVLEPVSFDEPPELQRYSRSRVLREAEQIRGRMQTVLDEMLAARASLWAG